MYKIHKHLNGKYSTNIGLTAMWIDNDNNTISIDYVRIGPITCKRDAELIANSVNT